MKRITLLFATLVITLIGNCQSEFEAAMHSNIDSLFRSLGSGAVQKPINTFERLMQIDSSRWEPLYYASYGYCMMSLRESDNAKKDAYCDHAQDLLTKAFRKSPGES